MDIKVLLITYWLKNESKDYAGLFAVLLSGKWWHYIESTWLIKTEESVDSWSDKIRAVVDPKDFFLVVDITGKPYNGWLPKEAWDWINEGAEKIAGKEQAQEIVKSGANTDLPPITEDILGDEETIERYLKNRGEQAYQADIVKESKLSESKISMVLSKMKDEGRIVKIRKGRKNVIRLAKKE